jgi:putative serine protease PepD
MSEMPLAPPPQPPTSTPSAGRRAVGAVALIAVAGAAGFGGAWLENRADSDTAISSLDAAAGKRAPAGRIEAVAAKVMPSVVQINVTSGTEAGSGSGIVISTGGDILTNNHVVEAAGKHGIITVVFGDGSHTSARVVGTDPTTDIAVVNVGRHHKLVPAALGDSAQLRVGQDVVAIGSPFGLESTVTSGIVSALNRPVESQNALGTDETTVFPAIQTDAAINPGNSGGPLVDLRGRVIGINAAIRASGTATESGSIGLGFAIPINLAKGVAQQLVAGKTVQHARIGVSVRGAVDKDEITGIGAQVKDVTKGSAGDQAGIKAGDIITAVDGSPIANSSALVAAMRGYQPGDTVTLTVLRDGDTKTIKVTLGSDGGKPS